MTIAESQIEINAPPAEVRAVVSLTKAPTQLASVGQRWDMPPINIGGTMTGPRIRPHRRMALGLHPDDARAAGQDARADGPGR